MQCNVGLGRVKEEIVLELTLEIFLKAHLAKIQATGKEIVRGIHIFRGFTNKYEYLKKKQFLIWFIQHADY